MDGHRIVQQVHIETSKRVVIGRVLKRVNMVMCALLKDGIDIKWIENSGL